MMRKCHLNTCPVGVATQNPALRKKFTGDPDHVVNYFKFLAEDLREIMAELGYRRIDEMVGQVHKLKVDERVSNTPYALLDLSPILHQEEIGDIDGSFGQVPQDHELNLHLDWELIKKAEKALKKAEGVEASLTIMNTDRAIGTILSNEISKLYGSPGLPEGTISYTFNGSAGQSFAAFATAGLSFKINGEANDYFGKGLSGAHISVNPAKQSKLKAQENQIIGNVALYGATSGRAYINGLAGERFAVRNSGAQAVVEGVGDHGCEYMTGGIVLILGSIGRNFAAGMSGGIAYILNDDESTKDRINHEMVDLDSLAEEDFIHVRQLISEHVEATGSALAQEILTNWQALKASLIKVMPRDYKAVLEKRKATKELA
jgi:glutamate synthase (NADPH/NADH) large chain